MDESIKEAKKRSEKIKIWLKNPYNILLILILVFALGVRLYYFSITQGQTLWWDEAEYMSTATHWAMNVPYDLNPQRPPLFQFLAALSLMIGLGENFIRFAFVLLPSAAIVLVVYFLGKEMYNQNIGLIASFFAAVSWTFLFWTERVQPDSFSMLFQVLSILFMWRFWKNNRTKSAILAGIFSAVAFYFKVSALLVPLSFMIFILIKERASAFKKKGNYYFAIAFLATLIPYFIWAYATFGDPLAFRSGYSSAVGTPTPFGWYNLGFFYSLTENAFFVLFLIGLLMSLKFFIYADVLVKEKERAFDPGIFSLIVLVITSAFYIFYIRGTEDRWVFLWMPFIFFMAGNAIILIKNFIAKNSKVFAMIVMIGLLVFIGYSQLVHADGLIKIKKDTYSQVKSAALWIKGNSLPSDLIISSSYTEMTYYAERKVVNYNNDTFYGNESVFNDFVKSSKPKFIEISAFERNPPWITGWLQNNSATIQPVQAYFADAAKTQPILIIYQVK